MSQAAIIIEDEDMFAVDDDADADNDARNNLNIETPNANVVELENVNNDENNVSDRIEEVIDPVTSVSDNAESTNDLNTTSDDFVEERVIKESRTSPKETTKKKTKGKKRKAAESIESTDSEEGSVCTICFEDWSNSGDHRIASLKCGHFFGYSCIDKWLRGSGNACPNCNEKNTKKSDYRFNGNIAFYYVNYIFCYIFHLWFCVIELLKNIEI